MTPSLTLFELLQRLVATLRDEQDAIRHLDADRIAQRAADKERLAEAIRAAPRATGGEEREVRVLAAQAQALAHANRLLIEEAAQSIGRRLGITESGVYDARARRVRPTRSPTRRAI